MKIKVIDNQTIYDIAKQYYGNIEAVGEILILNPDIRNHTKGDFQLDMPIQIGTVIEIDEKSKLRNSNVLRNIKREITLWGEHSEK